MQKFQPFIALCIFFALSASFSLSGSYAVSITTENLTYLHPEEVPLLCRWILKQVYSVSGLLHLFELSVSWENDQILLGLARILIEELELVHARLHVFFELDLPLASVWGDHLAIEIHYACFEFTKGGFGALLESLEHLHVHLTKFYKLKLSIIRG